MIILEKILAPPSMHEDGASYIVELRVSEGEIITREQIIMVLESNNYRLELTAGEDGTIEKTHCIQGQVVGRDALLLEIKRE